MVKYVGVTPPVELAGPMPPRSVPDEIMLSAAADGYDVDAVHVPIPAEEIGAVYTSDVNTLPVVTPPAHASVDENITHVAPLIGNGYAVPAT